MRKVEQARTGLRAVHSSALQSEKVDARDAQAALLSRRQAFSRSEASMTTATLGTFLRRLRRVAGPSGASRLTDAELLGRFAAGRDEAAFEVLLWRHGPMVLGVCRRVLGPGADVEDAFQATFL